MSQYGDLTAIYVLAFLALVAIVIVSVILTSRRSQTIIQRWAEDNGYQIVASEHRLFGRGPFLWMTGRGQTVHHVTVMDAAGRMRNGYLRCGSFWTGLLSDKAEARWEDESTDPYLTR